MNASEIIEIRARLRASTPTEPPSARRPLKLLRALLEPNRTRFRGGLASRDATWIEPRDRSRPQCRSFGQRTERLEDSEPLILTSPLAPPRSGETAIPRLPPLVSAPRTGRVPAPALHGVLLSLERLLVREQSTFARRIAAG
jgi:hypothetical protein